MAPENPATPLGDNPWAQFHGMPRKLTELLKKESDRGAILIASAYVEEILGLLIRSTCISDSVGKKLLVYRQPAGDFSSRIAICRAFGVIDHEEAQSLDLVRRIRNNAAHFEGEGRGFDVLFDSPGTADQVGKLAKIHRLTVATGEPHATRQAFIMAVRFLAMRLFGRGVNLSRVTPPPTLREHADAVREAVKGTVYEGPLKLLEDSIRAGSTESLKELFAGFASAVRSELDHIPEEVPTSAKRRSVPKRKHRTTAIKRKKASKRSKPRK